ncbi:MAG TPA: YciI family protein [Gaiellales bacterium]|jgi:uncharacterized protein YciI|nr:YciI family protein [Gaiellales bacterium]
MSDWLCIIRPPRPTFIGDMSEEERTVMGEHFAYLQGLLRQGRLLLAGPSLDPPFGIVVFVAESEEEAWALVRADPSVRAGVQTPELHPFRTSLLAGRD